MIREDFSPVAAGEKAAGHGGANGPGSNTGQKVGGGALVDYLTLVLPESALEERGTTKLQDLVATLFGSRHLVVGTLRDKSWQFYPRSAVILDREGELVGRIGIGGNAGTVCVSLSGAGTRWIRNWHAVAMQVRAYRARISRVDLAFDDYDGECLDVHAMRERALAGDFAEGGRPPRHRFLSDEGHGTGCTLYVGGKGHKELCIYEKGKQLGLPSSSWVRAEVRLYGKHMNIPVEALLRPLDYLLGAYSTLREVIRGVCTRIQTVRKAAQVSAQAMIEWARRQVGPTLHLLRQAFGSQWAAYCEEHVAREGHPARFRGIAKGDRLAQLVRTELCPASS